MSKVDTSTNTEQKPADESSAAKTYDLSKPDSIFEMFRDRVPDATIRTAVLSHIESLAQKCGLGAYKIIFLCDEHSSIDRHDANLLYRTVSSHPKTRDILLVLHIDRWERSGKRNVRPEVESLRPLKPRPFGLCRDQCPSNRG